VADWLISLQNQQRPIGGSGSTEVPFERPPSEKTPKGKQAKPNDGGGGGDSSTEAGNESFLAIHLPGKAVQRDLEEFLLLSDEDKNKVLDHVNLPVTGGSCAAKDRCRFSIP